ncbi:MAG TPA: site-specific DNA-methyltransferase, partial [Candidatus Cloacimonadota bacterium]|nr:site-specific DNA-methyltransferase [Candidatus Cloacimonadota bacterium]
MEEVKLNGQSLDIVKENILKLKQLFPEIVTEDNINFDKLRAVLGDYVEKDDESYRFTWFGKREAFRKSQIPSIGTLRPCKEESKDWETTQNLYIEGDNLEVLKLLQKSYNNKIKMIYIDPPYNKDKDFVYSDKWSDPIKEYKRITGQVDDEGNILSSDAESEGGRHTNWLNMIYPRLRLARNLLTDDGVIFISIDDDEVGNLKKICNEIFGEENFEGHIHWRRRHNQPNDKTKMIGLVAEHILVYAKDSIELKKDGVGKIDLTGEFSNPDNDPLGDWASKPWKVGSDQSGCRYTIVTPSGKVLDEEWMGEENTYKELLRKGKILFPRGGNGMPRKKYYKFEREEEGQCATNWWSHELFGHNQGANDCLTKLFGVKNVFSNPKPIELIKGLIQIANVKCGDIVLDFFSGSSTTAHSVIALNVEDKVNIRHIMVQLPESLDMLLGDADSETKKTIRNSIEFLDSINKPHFLTEIGKERIRRAGEGIKAELQKKYDEYQNRQQTILDDEEAPINPGDLDIGFKVFKLDDSNLKKWSVDVGDDFYKEDIETQNAILSEKLGIEVDNFVEGRSELDVVYEIMLTYGLDLSYSIETYDFNGTNIYSIGSGALIVCLDEDIRAELADKIIEIITKEEPSLVR